MTRTDRLLLIIVLLLVLGPSISVHALMGVPRSQLVFSIIDAVIYTDPSELRVDLLIQENANDHSDHILIPGRRISVTLPANYSDRLKIGSNARADFSGGIDDLGSGRISIIIHPESIEALETPADAITIEFSRWEAFFDAVPLLRGLFIAIGWLLTFELCFRKPTP
jgi:hypothetical protein